MIELMLTQIFLYVNFLVIGALLTVLVQHAYSYYLHKRHPEKTPEHHATPLPEDVKKQILKDAETNFKATLANSADKLQHDLKNTSDRLNVHLEKVGNEIIHKEMDRYSDELGMLYKRADKDVSEAGTEISKYIDEHKKKLDELHQATDGLIKNTNEDITRYNETLKKKLEEIQQEADKTMRDVTADLTQHKEELKKQIAEEIETEKAQLRSQVDSKLADAITGFLLETLKHNVDLGAQESYLTATLEEHKDELRKEALGEAKTAK